MTKLKFFALILSLLFTTLPCLAQTFSFAPLAQQIKPSVVNIEVTVSSDVNTPEVVNGLMFSSSDGHTLLGSGFVLEEDGFIATCAHLLEGAQNISVTLSDGHVYEASIVGEDEISDLAVLKIEPDEPLIPVFFGSALKSDIGDFVLASGNPFGLGNSISAGIISGKARRFRDNSYEEYIQTDAAITQGFSGGPLFNMDGQLVGINNALISTNGNFQGVSFALAAEDALEILERLKKAPLHRGSLGVSFGLRNAHQLTVMSILDETVATHNNLEVGDVILALEGKEIDTEKDFMKKVLFGPVHTPFEITILRQGKTFSQTVETSYIEQTPEPQTYDTPIPLLEETHHFPAVGLEMVGDIVSSVIPNSPAAQKGIEKGDVIVKANGEKLQEPTDLQFYIEEATASHQPLILEMENTQTNEPYAVELLTDLENNDTH